MQCAISQRAVTIIASMAAFMTATGITRASAYDMNFNFTQTSGDRDYYFGTHQPNGAFDSNTDRTYFQVMSSSGGVLDAYTSTSAWIVLDDALPGTSGGSSSNAYIAGKSLVLRTRLFNLTSATTGESASAGIAFGLSDTGGTSNGFLALVQNKTNGNNDDSLVLRNLTNGQADAIINTSGIFNYGLSGNYYFLQLILTPAETGVNYTLSLIADSSISGTGTDTTRMTSSDFASATTLATISGTLANYTDGYAGLYFLDNSTNAASNPNKGGVDFTNFYVSNSTIIPEPAAFGTLCLGGLAVLLKRKQ